MNIRYMIDLYAPEGAVYFDADLPFAPWKGLWIWNLPGWDGIRDGRFEGEPFICHPFWDHAEHRFETFYAPDYRALPFHLKDPEIQRLLAHGWKLDEEFYAGHPDFKRKGKKKK